MVSPASTRPLVLVSVGVPAVLVRLRVAAVEVAVDVLDVFEVTAVPPGFRLVALAEFWTLPASTSAWLIVYVAVHVVLAPGATVVVGQVVAPTFGSVMATAVRVWAPVLVTAKL